MVFHETFLDCYVHLEENKLTIGNSRMERSWSFAG